LSNKGARANKKLFLDNYNILRFETTKFNKINKDMMKAIVRLINVMGIMFNCNVVQGYSGAKHVNPNDIVTYKDLGNHMMSFYLTLKIYIFRSYNEISNIRIVCYKS
jgi:hypothetical protein